ncbi:unnamed protein product [Schistosoma margrebowiei]|uniref:Uncharacterized protein n=1 Tax=Schistosoma margrebowiei TaxID=48269 RepID=A0A183MVA1_9TREM|nr:unnamed protein product [Schistosoma margrebowiei]
MVVGGSQEGFLLTTSNYHLTMDYIVYHNDYLDVLGFANILRKCLL